jgi:pimeloyl-ACP methyl ester carboxylesterase
LPGGWASLLLAATNPDLVGPLVMNGAPVAAWSGHIGNSTMRYNGGFVGGALPALMLSDLGGGKFDGAHLVLNFEMLNPGRNYFAKYADLYANVDESHGEFLKFERWWGGFHFMNENEIRWIVEQLFVGNKLARARRGCRAGACSISRRSLRPSWSLPVGATISPRHPRRSTGSPISMPTRPKSASGASASST